MQNLRNETDDMLVQLYEEGNDSAFDILLERYQKNVYGYILALVCDEDRSNDIFQETFFKAIKYIRSHRYTADDKFLRWILRIARNLVVDSYRHGGLCVVDVKDEKARNRLMSDKRYADMSVEDNLHNEQTYAELEAMIEQLPEPQREVVKMRIYQNIPFKEIAVLTNTSINTALGRMRYATINLRKMAAKRDLTIVGLDAHMLE